MSKLKLATLSCIALTAFATSTFAINEKNVPGSIYVKNDTSSSITMVACGKKHTLDSGEQAMAKNVSPDNLYIHYSAEGKSKAQNLKVNNGYKVENKDGKVTIENVPLVVEKKRLYVMECKTEAALSRLHNNKKAS